MGVFRERQIASRNITVILPANEEVSVGSVVLLARQYADRVIVVDDGSSDRTAEVVANAGDEVGVHTTNKGKVLKGEADIVNGSRYLNGRFQREIDFENGSFL